MEKDVSYLNINQKVTALLAGRAVPNDEKDVLVIGTVGSLLAYNVDLNSDLFFKEVSDNMCLTLMLININVSYETKNIYLGMHINIRLSHSHKYF